MLFIAMDLKLWIKAWTSEAILNKTLAINNLNESLLDM